MARITATGGLEGVGVAAIAQHLLRRRSLDRQAELADGQQQGAEGDGLAGAQIPVRQHAADQRQQIDQRGVGPVLAGRPLVLEQEVLGQVVDQQSPHAVVGEPLPHLGEEQHEQPLGVALQLQQHRDGGGHGDQHAEHKDDVHACRLSPCGQGPAANGRRGSRVGGFHKRTGRRSDLSPIIDGGVPPKAGRGARLAGRNASAAPPSSSARPRGPSVGVAAISPSAMGRMRSGQSLETSGRAPAF